MESIEETKKLLAKNLIEYRKQAKMTQLEIAEKFSYSDKSVSKWERGEGIPDTLVLKQLAEFYGIKIDDFFRNHPKRITINQRRKHIIITLLSIGTVYVVATLVFVILNLAMQNRFDVTWLTFLYGVPVSAILCIIFSSIWGTRLLTTGSISLLIWSIAFCIYFTGPITFDNKWLVLIVPIPLQIVTILWFFLLKSKDVNRKKEKEA